jgi:hypothetical protein
MIVVCAIESPRSAIISTRSRKLSYRTHRTIISRSKRRPSNSSAKPRNLAIAPPSNPPDGREHRAVSKLHHNRPKHGCRHRPRGRLAQRLRRAHAQGQRRAGQGRSKDHACVSHSNLPPECGRKPQPAFQKCVLLGLRQNNWPRRRHDKTCVPPQQDSQRLAALPLHAGLTEDICPSRSILRNLRRPCSA